LSKNGQNVGVYASIALSLILSENSQNAPCFRTEGVLVGKPTCIMSCPDTIDKVSTLNEPVPICVFLAILEGAQSSASVSKRQIKESRPAWNLAELLTTHRAGV